MREIKCVQCGRIFTTNTWNASLCSDECRKIRLREQKNERQRADREGMLDNRKKPPKFKSTMKQLTKDAVEARKAGLSYGRYIARKNG